MKKLLPVAVLAAMAGVNGAHAVSVNPDGLGQVLLYPYYTVEGGQDTYINIVNTTDQVKAVKVRFRESLNSNEVLDFNLYLSPWDHWSAVITAGATDADAATVQTADTSCTVPAFMATTVGVPGPAIPFRNSLYTSDSQNGLNRTREGYVEIIEMGVVTGTLAASATHGSDSIPAKCSDLSAAWGPSGVWATSNGAFGVTHPTGGQYGYGVLIDVAEGTDATYDALALADFQSSIAIHEAPGDSLPNLSSGEPFADLFFEGGVILADADNSLDAVSMVLMQSRIANDFVLEPTIDAGTDWVITFPTKREYVNNGTTIADQPFTNVWDPKTSTACEPIAITYYNREEQPETPRDLDFSPQQQVPGFNLCAEANVLTFNSSNVLEASDRGTGTDLSVIFDNGWTSLSFDNLVTRSLIGHDFTLDADVEFRGLPTIGFAVQKYVNGTLQVDCEVGVDPLCEDVNQALLSNYAGSVTHKGTRLISFF